MDNDLIKYFIEKTDERFNTVEKRFDKQDEDLGAIRKDISTIVGVHKFWHGVSAAIGAISAFLIDLFLRK